MLSRFLFSLLISFNVKYNYGNDDTAMNTFFLKIHLYIFFSSSFHLHDKVLNEKVLNF